MEGALPKANRSRRSLPPPSDAFRAAALVEREELLMEHARCANESSYRHRMEIEEELSEIRRDLVRLGFGRSK
jgi:hypothetical protein